MTEMIRTWKLTAPQSGQLGDAAYLTPGEPVLVVAGLPEGADIKPLRDVPDGWEWQNAAGDWQTARLFDGEFECAGLVQCRPAPEVDLLAKHTAGEVARMFHENYERLAPLYGYQTREASAVPWEKVPEANRALMIATCAAVLLALRESTGSPETRA